MKEGSRILIVDKDSNFRALVGEAMDANGYHSIGTDNLQEALTLIDKADADAAIVGLDMPPMSGMKLLHKVKAEHPGFPIILVAESTRTYSIHDILSADFDAFLSKPIDLEHLIGAAKQL